MSFVILKDINVNALDLNARASSLRNALLKWESLKSYEVPVLMNVTFEAQKGDRIAVIGRNGSGKSSLLKVIAGIYPYDSGERLVNGNVAPLIEMGVGFDPEISGRDNIKLALIYSGRFDCYNKELENKIIEFSELEEKIDIPLKSYSTGMQSRLAFSVSIFQSPDILLLDEVFAAGDASFVKKSKAFMLSKMDEVDISVLVNHSSQDLIDICNKCYWLENGTVKKVGPPKDLIEEYEASV